MPGPLKTLFGALQASTFLSGVSLAFGEECIADESLSLPYVVMVPRGGQVESNGYEGNGDPAVERRYKISQRIDFYLRAASSAPNAQPVDHADAVETLRAQVLSAFQDQRAQYSDVSNVAIGLAFVPDSEQWATMQNSLNRYGRALVLTGVFELTVTTPVPQVATIASYQLNKTITQGPS